MIRNRGLQQYSAEGIFPSSTQMKSNLGSEQIGKWHRIVSDLENSNHIKDF